MIEETRNEVLSRIIDQALGKASMAWNPRPKGVFDSTLALEILKDTIEDIEEAVIGGLATELLSTRQRVKELELKLSAEQASNYGLTVKLESLEKKLGIAVKALLEIRNVVCMHDDSSWCNGLCKNCHIAKKAIKEIEEVK